MEFGPGNVAIVDPGRDGWVVGDEPNLLFELAEATREEYHGEVLDAWSRPEHGEKSGAAGHRRAMPGASL